MANVKITNLLPKFVGRVQQKAAGAMTKALVLGASEASVMTPIDTSTLINSQAKEVRFVNGVIVGRIIYSARYATYVHNPAVKQTFRRATAQKEFLRKGFARGADRIRELFKGALK